MLVVLAGAAQTACGSSPLQRGVEFYTEQRYLDADQVFEQSEQELAHYAAHERARYGLYRGATLLALGDHERARRWLAYGVRFERAGYAGAERSLLVRSLREVNSAPLQRSEEVFPPGATELAGTP